MKLVTLVKQAINNEFNSIEDVGMGMFNLSEVLCSVCKSVNLRVNRDKLLTIEKVYLNVKLKHNDEAELKIQERFDKVTK